MDGRTVPRPPGLGGELLQGAYVQKLLLFEHPKFGYVAEHRHDDQARVDTTIITPRDEFAVVYELRATGDRWFATESVVTGMPRTTCWTPAAPYAPEIRRDLAWLAGGRQGRSPATRSVSERDRGPEAARLGLGVE